MIILPSLLEYSRGELQNKLHLLTEHVDIINTLTHQNTLSLHLDMVMKHFAIDRKIMESLAFEVIQDELIETFKKKKLHLSVHLMGLAQDLDEIHDTLTKDSFVANWQYTLIVPEAYVEKFMTFEQDNVSIGVWYDHNEWPQKPALERTHLLMTVRAGLSGQKLTSAVKKKALAYTGKHPNNFILDGGWDVDFTSDQENVSIVSHSSFWKNLYNSIKN